MGVSDSSLLIGRVTCTRQTAGYVAQEVCIAAYAFGIKVATPADLTPGCELGNAALLWSQLARNWISDSILNMGRISTYCAAWESALGDGKTSED